MAFTLEVAESEIENLKDQVSETKKTFERAIQKIDGLELNLNNNNILLTKLGMTQNETLNAVKSIVENGGARCVERGFVIQQIEEAVKDLRDHACKNCKNETILNSMREKQKSLRVILAWMLTFATTIMTGTLIWYFTVGHQVIKTLPK